jgi:hypothetical protein
MDIDLTTIPYCELHRIAEGHPHPIIGATIAQKEIDRRLQVELEKPWSEWGNHGTVMWKVSPRP